MAVEQRMRLGARYVSRSDIGLSFQLSHQAESHLQVQAVLCAALEALAPPASPAPPPAATEGSTSTASLSLIIATMPTHGFQCPAQHSDSSFPLEIVRALRRSLNTASAAVDSLVGLVEMFKELPEEAEEELVVLVADGVESGIEEGGEVERRLLAVLTSGTGDELI